MEKIELAQLPKELRRAVEGDLAHYQGAKLLGCTKHESAPREDESKITTRYNAYVQWGGILTVWYTFGGNSAAAGMVLHDSMNIVDILFFMENSDWFKSKQRGA